MPELPEIESLKQSLTPYIQGKKLRCAIVLRRKLRFALPRNFEAQLAARKVKALQRRGKYLLIELEGDIILLIHLGMSGRLVFHSQHQKQKHDHVIFQFKHGDLVFNDPRRFGFMDIVSKQKLATHPRLVILGPEPLAPSWKTADLAQALTTRKTSIKAALFNQKIVAGLGNIYICEALFQADINPKRIAKDLDKAECQKLHRAIKTQLRRAVRAGGSTIQDYLNAKGKKGTFQHQFKVYARQEQTCLKLKCKGIISRITQNNRSTFYCPVCQK